ncbi:aldo/keto reductase [Photorhabdus viridis]|uniref:aldo/keto reductase n=1 Tax=Photorhabdus viridis TaxID=3163327 RepID=UPI00330708BD
MMRDFIIGTWQLGGEGWSTANINEAYEALGYSLDNGVTELDTAPTYGSGKSEQLIGKILKETSNNNVKIITKIPPNMMSKEKVIDSVKGSLDRLDVESVETVLIHWPAGTMGTDLIDIKETCEGLNIVRDSNLCKKIGICNYEYDSLIEIEENIDIDVYQYSYSPLFRGVENKILTHVKKRGKEFQAYSPLSLGILTNNYNKSIFDCDDHRNHVVLFDEKVRKIVHEARENIEKVIRLKDDIALAALSWVQKKGAIPIIGAHKIKYVKYFLENKYDLSNEQVNLIDNSTSLLKSILKKRISLWG